MRIRNLIIGVVFVLLLSSCGTEIKLAKRYVNESRQYKAAVFFPEAAKVTLIQNEDGEYTKVLDSLNQDVFLDIVYASYSDAMRDYGVEVYIPEDPDRVQVDSAHWLVVVSQVEIQGLFTTYEDYLFDLIETFEYTFPLNTVNVAAWFDINDGEWHPTLFCEHNLRDDFSSRVARTTEGSRYYYDIKTLKINDIYNYAAYLGALYADFTYNNMMNRYISDQMGKSQLVPRFKLRWDPYEKSFYFQEEEEGFIELIIEN